MPVMPLTINLLGRPHLHAVGSTPYRFRSQKSWVLLAYLLLADRPVPRATLAGLLFEEADDPLRALRWSLAEVRRGLGDGASVEGDPVSVHLPVGAVVDVDAVMRGGWRTAIAMPGVAHTLLEGVNVHGSHAFEVWLSAERRRLAAASEAILHEAALGLLAAGDRSGAIDAATRAVALNPLDENSQALLIQLLRESGDAQGARMAYDAAREVLEQELGIPPGPAIESAWRVDVTEDRASHSRASVEAVLEAGSAAIDAGAAESGLASLRTAVALADDLGIADLRMRARIVLAEALIHSVRGRDEEGIAALHAADAMAMSEGTPEEVAQIRTELGYVDFLRARYDRAEHWLSDALARAGDRAEVIAGARAYLGSVDSDRARYPQAMRHLELGAAAAREIGATRREAYAISMMGRIHLLRGEWDAAEQHLRHSVDLCQAGRWLALLPWPQALLGEVLLARGDVDEAGVVLEQAFARACQLADPCWEGTAERALALVCAARGDVDAAFARLADARTRSRRVSDGYVWLDAYILDAMAGLGVQYGHPGTAGWVDSLQSLAQRTEMREMSVRSLVHGAALGRHEDAEGARLLVSDIDNDALAALVASVPGG